MSFWIIILEILVVIVLAALIIDVYELHHLVTKKYDIVTEKIPPENSIRLVFLSDLHGKIYGIGNCELVKLVKEAQPDLILVGGDLIIRGNERYDHVAVSLVKELSKIAGVLYAPGNHEGAVGRGNPDRLSHMISQFDDNVKYFVDDTINVNDSVSVSALGPGKEFYRKAMPKTMTKEDVDGFIGKNDRTRYNILLAHSPAFFDACADYGADLVLSGHYHGGVIGLPKGRGAIVSDFKLFAKHSHGVFREKGSTLIVTTGCGSHKINVRIFNRPEIVVINLKGHM